ncbi:RteC domain-containing protein [Gelidibacter sp.]|uniref:RteC domain-containing protein n=1 Tax=Gelidibacter sp. TaxID=2018083 RepID=UPI0039C887AF
MRSIYEEALLSILKEEEEISFEAKHVIEESYHMIVFLRNLLSDLKNHVLENGFMDDNEEIVFFKTIKPQILGKLIYYNKVFRIETSRPVNVGKMYFNYFSDELQELKQDYKEHSYNSEFYRYYRTGRTDYDREFFLLGKINPHIGLNSFIFEIDTQFSTYYDYKVSRIIANELLYNYLLAKITPDDSVPSFHPDTQGNQDFLWTESKNALIELIYALYVSKAISGGKVGIRKIARVFQILFNVQLGDVHHAFHRMKDRAGNRTAFLDQIKMAIEQYMDKDL